jgi:hypothetical protein
MSEPISEYRQDDTNEGYCPACARPLHGVTKDGRGVCEEHGWTWADWNVSRKEAEHDCEECEDGDALREGQTCLTCGIERLRTEG